MIRQIPFYSAFILLLLWIITLFLPAIDGVIGLMFLLSGWLYMLSTGIWAWLANPLFIALQGMIIFRGRYRLTPFFWGTATLFSLLILGALWDTFNSIDYNGDDGPTQFADYGLGAMIWFWVLHLGVINTQLLLMIDSWKRTLNSGIRYLPLIIIPIIILLLSLLSLGLLMGIIDRELTQSYNGDERENYQGEWVHYRWNGLNALPQQLSGETIYQTRFNSRITPNAKGILTNFNGTLMLDLSDLDLEPRRDSPKSDSDMTANSATTLVDVVDDRLLSEAYWLEKGGIKRVIIPMGSDAELPNNNDWSASHRLRLSIDRAPIYGKTTPATLVREWFFRPAIVGNRLQLSLEDRQNGAIIYHTSWQLQPLSRGEKRYRFDLDLFEESFDSVIDRLFSGSSILDSSKEALQASSMNEAQIDPALTDEGHDQSSDHPSSSTFPSLPPLNAI